MIKFNINKKADSITLSIDGELTIENSSAFHENLLSLLGDEDHIRINVQGVTEIDLLCLQLLCALHKSVMISQKQMTIINSTELFSNAVIESGFSRNTGCKMNVNDNCLWRGYAK